VAETDANRDLAETLGALAQEMQAQSDTPATLRSIVDASITLVPGARWAGISLIRKRHVIPQAPSDLLVAELDQLQTDLGEGPCLSALRDHHTVHIDDMAAETRWPRFVRAAVERGVRSLLSFQLFVREENLGALNLYSDGVATFTEESVVIGELFAQHAAVAMVGAAERTQFHSALASRDAIGQAKGILMHRDQLTAFEAFELLVRTSQNVNMKVVNIAHWLIDDHEAQLHR
jgi:GAF domain-containing protein